MVKKSTLKAAGKGVTQGVTLGFADEATSSLGAILARTMRPDLFEHQSYGETYREGMEDEQYKIAQHKENAPVAYTLGEILGAVVSPASAVGGGIAAKGVGKAMSVGATEGAAYGFGTGYGTEDRLEGAVVDGAIGAVSAGMGKLIVDDVAKHGGFKKWAKAKYADETGAIGYHGTNAHAYTDGEIDRFHTNPDSGRGAAFFSSSKDAAGEYGEKIYKADIDLKNPLVIDGDGAHWSDLRGDLKISGKVTDTLKKQARGRGKEDELLEIFKEMDALEGLPNNSYKPNYKFDKSDTLDGFKLSDITGEGYPMETDGVAKLARKLGYDGVIFKNINDSPTADKIYSQKPSDVYAVFDSDLIKKMPDTNQVDDVGKTYYHGTTQDFDEFKGDTVFLSETPELAEIYARPDVKGANIRPVVSNATKTFDTTNPKHREIFEQQFYRKYGNGAPLSEKGFPDWTDAEDFKEFFSDTGLDFDSVRIQEPQGDVSLAVLDPKKVRSKFDVRSLAALLGTGAIAQQAQDPLKQQMGYNE